jgi:hypothetical protein
MADQYKSVAELMKNLHEAFANWQWYLWGLSSIITIFLARKNRRTHGFSTEMLIPVVGGILGGFFGLLKVLLYIAANKAEMQGKLDWDGCNYDWRFLGDCNCHQRNTKTTEIVEQQFFLPDRAPNTI